MRKITISLWFLFCCCLVFGKNVNPDSLKNVLTHCEDVECQMQNAYGLAAYYVHADEKDSLKRYLNYCFDLEVADTFLINPLFLKVGLQSKEKNYVGCDSTYTELHAIILKKKDNQQLLSMYNASRGIYFHRQKMADSAIVYYKASVDALDSSGKDYYTTKSTVYGNMGVLEKKRGNLEKAIQYYQVAEDCHRKADFSDNQKCSVLYNLALMYKSLTDFEASSQYLEKANSLAGISDNKRHSLLLRRAELAALMNREEDYYQLMKEVEEVYNTMRFREACNADYILGQYYLKTKINDYGKAKFHLQKMETCLQEGVKDTSEYYELSGEYALKIGENQKAYSSFKKSEEIQRRKGIHNEQPNRYMTLLKDLMKAGIQSNQSKIELDKYLDRYEAHRKVWFDQVVSNEIEKYAVRFDTRHKADSIKMLTITQAGLSNDLKAKRMQNTAMGVGLLSLLCLLGLGFYFYKNQQKQNQILTFKNEKIETLHRELSHRVKNNLAFVSGLMRMQQRRLESAEAKQAVKEGEARIEAMSLLHRKLYHQEDSDVNVSEYLQELCTYLQNTYPTSGKIPKVNLQIDDLKLDGETVVRLGLIVNELVTNSFKHAFKDQRNPKIELQMHQTAGEKYRLIYEDNGSGMPLEFDINKTKSLGLKLINTLTKQLDGTLHLSQKEGACFQFDFKRKIIAI